MYFSSSRPGLQLLASQEFHSCFQSLGFVAPYVNSCDTQVLKTIARCIKDVNCVFACSTADEVVPYNVIEGFMRYCNKPVVHTAMKHAEHCAVFLRFEGNMDAEVRRAVREFWGNLI